jgi:HK97 gp10 family phage protein
MVQGVHQFNTFLTRALPDALRKAARQSLTKSGSELVAGLQAVAPYDTGELKTAVSYRLEDTPTSVSLTVIGGDDRTVEHSKQKARLQEFGTVDMPASPWFFPLYRRRKRAIHARLNRDLKKAIKDIAGRAS